jgi:hypothetical protein
MAPWEQGGVWEFSDRVYGRYRVQPDTEFMVHEYWDRYSATWRHWWDYQPVEMYPAGYQPVLPGDEVDIARVAAASKPDKKGKG